MILIGTVPRQAKGAIPMQRFKAVLWVVVAQAVLIITSLALAGGADLEWG